MTFWDKWIFTSFGSAVAVAMQNGLFADLPLLPNKVPPLPEQRLHPKLNFKFTQPYIKTLRTYCQKHVINVADVSRQLCKKRIDCQNLVRVRIAESRFVSK